MPREAVCTLQLPISDRTEDDTCAMALSVARVCVEPTGLTTDLQDIRTAIKEALKTLRETPNDSQVLWLTPFIPKRVMKRMVHTGSPTPTVPCTVPTSATSARY